jgi:hypothetical protein
MDERMKNKSTWMVLKDKLTSGNFSGSGDDGEDAAATTAVVGGGDGGLGVNSPPINKNSKANKLVGVFESCLAKIAIAKGGEKHALVAGNEEKHRLGAKLFWRVNGSTYEVVMLVAHPLIRIQEPAN